MMTVAEFQAEMTKRGAIAMMVFSSTRDKRLHVTLTESAQDADARDARPSERGYGSEADEDWEKAVRVALEKYDESLR